MTHLSTSGKRKKAAAGIDLRSAAIPAVYFDAKLHPVSVSESFLPLLKNGKTATPPASLQEIERIPGLAGLGNRLRNVLEHEDSFEETITGPEAKKLSLRLFPVRLFSLKDGAVLSLCAADAAKTPATEDASPEEAVLHCDAAGQVTAASASFYHLFFAAPGHVLGHSAAALFEGWGAPDLLSSMLSLPQDPARIHRRTFTCHIPGFEERSFHLRARWRKRNAQAGPVLSLSFRDETRRQQNCRQLQNEVTRLRESNAELEKFASLAAHDMKEPMVVASIYTELFAEKNKDILDAESLQYAQSVRDMVKRMVSLIDDLLRFARLDTRTPFSPVRLDDTLNTVISNLHRRIEECDAMIHKSPLPEITGNPALLMELFQNLFSNALKFRSSRIPEIRVSAEQSQDEWIIRVEDNGMGIPADSRDRIFNMFERLNDKETYPGSGLGLAIARKIVEHHGGRIWVESCPGEGSCFFIAFPATES